MNFEDWVPAHRRIMKGAKKGLSRGVRFVLLELSLESRPTRGVLEFPPSWSTLDGVHDLIGGNRKEIAVALAEFQKLDSNGEQTIQIERDELRHRLIITKWEEWAGPKSSTERSQEHRARLAEERKTKHLDSGAPLRGVARALRDATNATPTGQDSRGQEKREDPPYPPGGMSEPLESDDGDPSRPLGSEPRPRVVAPANLADPAAGSPLDVTPERRPTSHYDLAWRVWKELYAKSKRGYGVYVDGGIKEERAMASVAHRAELADLPPAEAEVILRHWFISFLRDDGEVDFLAKGKHRIALFERRLPVYGMPKPKAASGVVKAALPIEAPMPIGEHKAQARTLVAALSGKLAMPAGGQRGR